MDSHQEINLAAFEFDDVESMVLEFIENPLHMEEVAQMLANQMADDDGVLMPEPQAEIEQMPLNQACNDDGINLIDENFFDEGGITAQQMLENPQYLADLAEFFNVPLNVESNWEPQPGTSRQEPFNTLNNLHGNVHVPQQKPVNDESDWDNVASKCSMTMDDVMLLKYLCDHDPDRAIPSAGMVVQPPMQRGGESDDFKPEDYYALEDVQVSKMSKFRTVINDKRIKFRNLSEIAPANYVQTVAKIFEDIIETATAGMKNHDMVRFYICNKAWNKALNMPYMRIDEMTGHRVLQEFMKTDQSHGALGLEAEDLDISIITTSLPEPAAGWYQYGDCRNRPLLNLAEWLKMKRCAITSIDNKDDLCVARSLVVAIAHSKQNQPDATRVDLLHYKQICKTDRSLQKEEALKLHHQAGVPVGKCGIPEIQKFQDFLKHQGYRLYVFSAEANFDHVFVGPDTCTKPLCLLLHNQHCCVLTSLTAFFNRSYFCWLCLKGITDHTQHNCKKMCHCCRDVRCHPEEGSIHVKCGKCLRYFRNLECHQYHLDNGTCSIIRRCETCHYVLYKHEVHTCWQHKCKYCKEMVERNHLCYIQQAQKPSSTADTSTSTIATTSRKRKATDPSSSCQPPKKQKKGTIALKPIIYYFDFEATQETGIHKGNLVVVQREDGAEQKIFANDAASSARDKFCSWIFDERCGYPTGKGKPTQPLTFIAHYMKGYDGYFVLEYLYQHNLFPEVIFTGSKLMLLSVPKSDIKFIDSFNFLSMPLAKFPATFGLTELKKGYFPHLFNTEANQEYVGPIPDASYYSPDSKSTSERKSFLQWHGEQVEGNVVFNLKQELIDYCVSDVTILREGCERFRSFCKNLYEVDPLVACTTLAQFCQLVYRTHFMPKDSMAILPQGGYCGNFKQSAKGQQWLMWLNYENGQGESIQHARNGGEVTVLKNYKADGFDAATKTVYEFHGCYFHGCQKCFTPDTVNTLRHCTMGEAYALTMDRTTEFRENGFNVVEMWECVYDQLLKSDERMKTFVEEKCKILDRLDPRNAFFGGRTNCAKMHYKVKEGEVINYYDFVSLYPTINKYGKMPVGHPKIITCPPKPYVVGDYYGFVHCTVLPPRTLYHPVLPYRSQNRLLFPLCRTCCDLRQTQRCRHNKEERAITGTWITPEMDKALEMGYKILQTHEVWHFEETAEYGAGNSKYPQGLFGGYVDGLLKVKQEASGWPKAVATDGEKGQFVEDYFKKEGIRLDPNNITLNPGLRTTAKLMLNSLWGKFGQRENLPKNEYVTKLDRFIELLVSPDNTVTNVQRVNDETVLVTYTIKNEFIEPSGRTNIFIAAFTTGLARLKLYELLDRLGTDVLYMDTDSVLFKSVMGVDKLHDYLGDTLGKVTNEIAPGLYIVEFISGGAKNYAYVLVDGSEKWVVSGLSQCFKNQQKMGFDVIKSMVLSAEGHPETIVLRDSEIVRDKYTGALKNRDTTKTYSVHFSKGIVDEETHTVYPYGYDFGD